MSALLLIIPIPSLMSLNLVNLNLCFCKVIMMPHDLLSPLHCIEVIHVEML